MYLFYIKIWIYPVLHASSSAVSSTLSSAFEMATNYYGYMSIYDAEVPRTGKIDIF